MRRFLAAFALTLCLAAPAVAGEFEDGLDAYDSGDYENAVIFWIPSAAHGNALAQFNLGVMTLEGKGVPPNPIQGLAWILMGLENMPDGENRNAAVELRDKIIALLTPDEIKKAEDLTRQLQKEHKQATTQEPDAPTGAPPAEKK